MSMYEWAKKEVELACAREWAEANKNGDSGDYGCACYESALKAFESLLGDGHSGCSIGITKNILLNLIEGRPLTPIEDTPDIWNEVDLRNEESATVYQCKRMHSLFKSVHPDGTVTYSDVDRVRCVDINNRSSYTSGFVTKQIDRLLPIKMPYRPDRPMCVYCEDFLVDPKNGDFDTKGILYILTKSGRRKSIGRYFKEVYGRWVKIDKKEYLERRAIAGLTKGENK